MNYSLTQKQQKILDFIDEFNRRESMSPTIDEIAHCFRITSATVFAHLRALQRKGFIDRSSKARSLLLTRNQSPKHLSMNLSIPILGKISAGLPLFAEQNVEQTIQIDPAMLPWGTGGQRLYGLHVSGDSMINKGIHNGDLIIAKEQAAAEIGSIVIALVKDSDEATVKTFYLGDGKIELRPENEKYDSQYYNFDDVIIQGIVIALYRKYKN